MKKIKTEIEPKPTVEEMSLNNTLRPLSLDEYIGQEELKKSLKIYIQAAKARNEALDHLLFYGPPGLGKTTLAGIIANEMQGKLRTTSAPVIEKAGDLASILVGMQNNDVLFIDEIHRLPKNVEEMLYSAMEDKAVDIIVGKDGQAKSIRLSLANFTLIGATTRAGMLSPPLRDRFGIIHKMEYYTNEELAKIVERTSSIFSYPINTNGALAIAKRSRGTPRLANRLFKRVRDFAEVNKDKEITDETAQSTLDFLKIDEFGLNDFDREILTTIIYKFNNQPVGIKTLAAALGEDTGVIEDVNEPFLLKMGLLNKTPRGRVVTELGLKHLGLNPEDYIAEKN